MTRVAVAIAATAASAWAFTHRRSLAVRVWEPPSLQIRRHGALSYRRTGPDDADTGVVLLHGLVATGDIFGSTPTLLGTRHRVIVPDLLGFGRSLDEHRTDFSTTAHIDALDDLIAHELGDRTIRIGAHSMGSALALRWAATHPNRTDRVVCVGAPIWPDAGSAEAALSRLGPMGKSLVLDRRLARAVCSLNCRHRTLAGILAAAIAPRWPLPVARQASLHTWPAYIAALEDQIIDCPWRELMHALADANVPVLLIRGEDDTVGDCAAQQALAEEPGVVMMTVEGDHTLPASHPTLLVNALQ